MEAKQSADTQQQANPAQIVGITVLFGALGWALAHYVFFPGAVGFHLGPLIGFAISFLVWPAVVLCGALAIATAAGLLKDERTKRSDGWVIAAPAVWLSCIALAWPPEDFGSAAIREAAAGPDFSKSTHQPSLTAPEGPSAQPPQADAIHPADAYVARLERDLADIDNINPKAFSGSVDEVRLGAAVFPTWAAIYEQGADLTLRPEHAGKREAFKAKASQAQSRAFPILRDAYVAAVDKAGWRGNLEARALGDGCRIIEIIWPGFASNANIEDFQKQMQEDLIGLRFREARYRWHDGAGKYTSYALQPAADDALMVFEDQTFRPARN